MNIFISFAFHFDYFLRTDSLKLNYRLKGWAFFILLPKWERNPSRLLLAPLWVDPGQLGPRCSALLGQQCRKHSWAGMVSAAVSTSEDRARKNSIVSSIFCSCVFLGWGGVSSFLKTASIYIFLIFSCEKRDLYCFIYLLYIHASILFHILSPFRLL